FLHEHWVPDRDVILFDQRGTGRATPSLDCPAAYEAVWTALGAAAPAAQEGASAANVLRDCHTQLVRAGIHLDQFSTPITADDVADIKRALGINTWNLFGVSYGTTVALEMARRHPTGVRSVVIDSVLPPTVAGDAQHQADVVHRALRALFDGCAADPRCDAAYPTLAADFSKLVAEWNAR